MDVLTELLSVSNIMLCLAIVALVWVQRKGMEILAKKWLKKDLKKSKVWTEFFVPLGPLGTGAVLMLTTQLPVPEMFDNGRLSRMVFGLGLGLISGLVFRLIKKNFLNRSSENNELDQNIELDQNTEEDVPYIEE